MAPSAVAPADADAPDDAHLVDTPMAPALDRTPRRAAALVAALAITLPLPYAAEVWATPTGAGDWSRRLQVAPFDVVLVLIAAWAILNRSWVVDLFRSRAVRWVAGAFVAWFLVALAAHPSALGFGLAARLGAGLAVIAACAAAASTPRSRLVLFAAVTGSGVAQACIGMAQSATGAAVGPPLDWGWALFEFGTSSAAQGGLPHPYHLTTFLLVAQAAALLGLRERTGRRWLWLAALGVLAVGVSITYSRAALLGQVAVVVAALVARRDRRLLWAAAAAIVIGMVVGAVGFGDGWTARSTRTVGAQEGASIDSGRRERLQEAAELIEAQPVTGIGPGRYVEELHLRMELDRYQPAHNLIAHEAAELGIAGGVAVTALLLLLGLRVLRGGSWTAAVTLPIVSMVLLGSTPYVVAASFSVSAIWLGLVRASLDGPEPELDPSSEGDAAVEAPTAAPELSPTSAS